MHSFTLQMQSHPPLIDPSHFNPKPLSQVPQSYNSRNPNLSFGISHQPQKPITIISAQRKNQKGRSPWRKAVEKSISFAAPEPLNPIPDDGGVGGGGSEVGGKKKGFGGEGFERIWELGVASIWVWGWVLCLVLGRRWDFGYWFFAPALCECSIRVWGRRRKRGSETWCRVLGVLAVTVGLRWDGFENDIVEDLRDRFWELASELTKIAFCYFIIILWSCLVQ